MLVDFKVSLQNTRQAIVSWTSSNASNISWIFGDGGILRGPLLLGVVNRTMQIPFVDSLTRAIEVHDFAVGSVVPDPIEITPNTQPIINWVAAPGALRYKVFLTPFGGSESLIYNKLAEEEKLIYQIECPVVLAAGWNFFRVESLDEFGNESVRVNWNYLVFDLPAPANDVTIVDGSGSGLFDIAIT